MWYLSIRIVYNNNNGNIMVGSVLYILASVLSGGFVGFVVWGGGFGAN